MFSLFKSKPKPRLRSSIADVIRGNYQIESHLNKYNARASDSWADFDKKLFPEFAAGIMWGCSLEIFDRIADDLYIVSEFNHCDGDLLFLECAIFPPIAIMVLENNGKLGNTTEFESFHEVLETIYADLELFYRAQKHNLPEFQQQRIEQYMHIENVDDWFKAVCSMFYQLFRARSNSINTDVASELKPVHPMLEGNFEVCMSVQSIAEASLDNAIKYMKNVIYEFSEDAV